MSASQPPESQPVPSQPGERADIPTLLVKIFGKDRPGITAGLFDTLAAYAVDVVDIEQVVTRGRIVLCALVTVPGPGRRHRGRTAGHRAQLGRFAASCRPRSSPVPATTGRAAADVRMSPCSEIR